MAVRERVRGRDPEFGEAAIYVLVDAEGTPLYAGSTTQKLEERLRQHWQGSPDLPWLVAVEYVSAHVRFAREAALWDELTERGHVLRNAVRPDPVHGGCSSRAFTRARELVRGG